CCSRTRASWFRNWSRAVVSRRSCCSRSISRRCTPNSCAAAPKPVRARTRTPDPLRVVSGHERPVAVLGAGSWGTALAVQLTRNGVPTTLWGRTPQAVVDLATTRRNDRYLPDLELPDALQFSAALETTVRDAGSVLIAVPSHAFGALLDAITPWLADDAGIAWATKGFDPASGRFLHELVAERRPGRAAAVVTGPSFAREVAQGLPTALTVHSADADFALAFARKLHSLTFRAYTGNDVVGAELGGAMKNVLAVA